MQQMNRTASPIQQQMQHQQQYQHAQQPNRQHPPSSQPPLKRERLNDHVQPQQPEAAAARGVPAAFAPATHGGSVAFAPAVYNPVAPTAALNDFNGHPHKKPPPPPPGSPPLAPPKPPLNEQILAVECLFAVPSLLACVPVLRSLRFSVIPAQNSLSRRMLAGLRSWTVAKTQAVALELSRSLHANMSMTYDYEVRRVLPKRARAGVKVLPAHRLFRSRVAVEKRPGASAFTACVTPPPPQALRMFMSRIQSGSNSGAGAGGGGHGATQLPPELTAKLGKMIGQVVAAHYRMN